MYASSYLVIVSNFFLSGTHPNSRVPNMHITVCNQCIDYFLKSAFYMAYIVHFKMMKQVHLTETVWNACTKNGTKAKLLIWFLHPIDWMHRSTLNGLFSICIVYLNDLCIIYYYIVTKKKLLLFDMKLHSDLLGSLKYRIVTCIENTMRFIFFHG